MNKQHYLENLSELLKSKNVSDDYTHSCLEYAIKLIDSEVPVIFDLKHLSLLIGISIENLSKLIYSADLYFYKELKIPKKSGGYRTINIPSYNLKYIQRWILDNILVNIKISSNSFGFVKNKSILDNAVNHLNKECIMNVDIKDFFPSITF